MNLPTQPKTESNDSSKTGLDASNRVNFGDFGRYVVYAIHTRFDSTTWIVEDFEIEDELTRLPAVIRMNNNFAKAVKGLV